MRAKAKDQYATVDERMQELDEKFGLDFKQIELNYGEYHMFNGNQCIHGNKPNKTNLTRISFDFRIMPIKFYDDNTKKISATTKRKFQIGVYYE